MYILTQVNFFGKKEVVVSVASRSKKEAILAMEKEISSRSGNRFTLTKRPMEDNKYEWQARELKCVNNEKVVHLELLTGSTIVGACWHGAVFDKNDAEIDGPKFEIVGCSFVLDPTIHTPGGVYGSISFTYTNVFRLDSFELDRVCIVNT